MKVIAAVLAAVAGLVDERADDMDAEPADGALFRRLRQIRPAKSKWIERLPIVDEADPEAARPPPEHYGDGSSRRKRAMTMRYGVGEELIQNDQKPRPLVIWQTALVRELIGKGVKPPELRMLAT